MPGLARALNFVRQDVSVTERDDQRAVFAAACSARAWQAGGTVYQTADRLHEWAAVVRLVHSGAYDRLATTEAGRMAVLGMLRRTGIRVLAVCDGVDTGDPVGCALVDSLFT
ncbi:hypothetical protein CcI6DRAFT_04425 [Frankia sp. CcI6]|uniref:hypothetical protein n=1 Tax=Frankia TaxID=1854 RepID=UPI0003D03E66|nr:MULTISPECIES: hypothetical protein [Frankia]ETA00140.1 hypothetical protein CcI6DRAFT_04425 [Frankia sp. CcI6]KDA41208.1 hypothetical protein BMG523Draft_03989 [Frankia sp. BMG5.23]KFB02949.1 hypothetical protein ALLO2DRAFT_04274 [Frankia sp. Allo2]OAA19567.1 hypothetical protein AAY23_11053 [Frankia casuarinae]OFB39868.1 hypothetical protein Manayef4_19940 [Frankia sp. CgIM4]